MKQSAKEFLNAPHKAITFMGMSGVGKTHLASDLAQRGWTRYSCDYEIGNRYLADNLAEPMRTADDISLLSDFIGRPGNTAKGGMAFEEFRRRQNLYYKAECRSVLEAAKLAKKTQGNFVHDSTGSLCEIMDEEILEELGRATLFVYLKASPDEEKQVLERAQQYPKPLFFPPGKLETWVDDYLSESGDGTADTMEPDAFSRWVFPKLFASRLPKYQRLADMYGVTVASDRLHNVKDENDFLDRIAGALQGVRAA